jgi:glycerol-1-phosphatase
VRIALADAYDAFLFDLDGVLYRGTEVVPGAPQAIARLRASGKRVAFVANNSGRTPEAVAAHLTGLGIPATAEEVETSALVTAAHLAARGISEAFVVGEQGILRALQDAGIAIAVAEADRTEVVVVGWDRQANYEKLRRASLLVERGAVLVATNADASYPAEDGNWPGAGALLAAIETTTGALAEVFGKPESPIMLAALDRAGGGTPLVIGDRLETDIAAATALGWDSLLVLTGISGPDDVASSPVAPTFVAQDLSALFAPPSP